MADAATGIGDVAGVARDYVEVELRHCLAGGWAVVEAEVEGVGFRIQLGGQVLLGPVDPDEQAGFLGVGEFLEPSDWTAGNNQCVAWRDGELVGDNCKQVVGGQQTGWFDIAEGWEGEFGCHFRRSVFGGRVGAATAGPTGVVGGELGSNL